MKAIAIFIAGLVLGAAGAVIGFFVADYVERPGGSRR